MNGYLFVAGLLTFGIALAHTILGERLVIAPVLKMKLPPLLKSTVFMRRTIRYAWHLATVVIWGFSALFIWFSFMQIDDILYGIVSVCAVTFLCCSLLSLFMTRGRHFSWYVFLMIAVCAYLGVR
ncbi:hypothetical protein ACFL6I_07365 [candidate division KSB1 bacterium]